MSKFCSKCGKEVADGVKFCDGCGQAMEETVAANTSAPVTGENKTNGTVALVCGIVSLILAWWGYFGFVAIALGIVAIIFAIKAKKGGKNGMATGGLVCGIVGIVIGAIFGLCTVCTVCVASSVRTAIEDSYSDIDWDWD